MKVWHLSAVNLGPCPILLPRIPRDRARGEDGRIARICVAPTIAGCLIALRGCYYNTGRWFAYSIDDANVTDAHRVPDAATTGELWLLTPERCRYEGIVVGSL